MTTAGDAEAIQRLEALERQMEVLQREMRELRRQITGEKLGLGFDHSNEEAQSLLSQLQIKF